MHQVSLIKLSTTILSCFVVLLITAFLSCENKTTSPTTILLDPHYLTEKKKLINSEDSSLSAAYNELIGEAEKAMSCEPFSVTDKQKLPPSGNKHDYISYSRYWWPDATKVDGLPYVRRDGITNPSSQDIKISDRPRIGAFAAATETLGLAYYFSDKEKYAKKAAELIRVWFLDEATKMNTHLNHAQCRPGHNEGTKSGILDGRLLIKALETSLLIFPSGALSDSEYDELKKWTKEYYKWLSTDEMALAEKASKNNHGSYYDVQAAYLALYSDQKNEADEILHSIYEERTMKQILPDGSMPKELARTRPLFYSVYNMHALLCAAQLGKNMGIDIWHNEGGDSRLLKGLDYIIPYTVKDKEWPTPSIGTADRMDFFPLLLVAEQRFPEKKYGGLIKNLDSTQLTTHRANLALPLMR